MIKAITFDLGGTLIESKADFKGFHSALASHLLLKEYKVRQPELDDAIEAATTQMLKIEAEGRETTFEEVYRSALLDLSIEATDSILEEIRGLFLSFISYSTPPCVDQLLVELLNKYKLGMICNTIHDLPHRIVNERGWGSYFSSVVVSRAVGYRKPRPEIFKVALGELGVSAGEVVHVGDSIEADVEGASAMGITPVWVSHGRTSEWQGYVIDDICDLPRLLTHIKQ